MAGRVPRLPSNSSTLSSAAARASSASPAALAVSERQNRFHARPWTCPETRAISTAASEELGGAGELSAHLAD